MPRRLTLAFALLAAALAAQNTKYTARDAGEVTIKYSTPMWREELLKRASPGMWWRLGAGGVTTVETTAAIVGKEDVVFPGTYNLGCRILEEWAVLFHKDGQSYNDGAKYGLFPLTKTEVTDKAKASARLQIDLEAGKEKAQKAAGDAIMRIRFGPHVLETIWRVVGVAKKRCIVDSLAFSLESLKLPAIDEYQAAFDGKGSNPLTVGRLTPEGPGTPAPILIQLLPGAEPTLKFKELSRDVKGTRATTSSPTSPMKAVVELGTLKLSLGTAILTFPIDADLLKKVETGATTPK